MNGYNVKQYNQPVKRYCQMLDLKDAPELIATYEHLHSQDVQWQEIRDGIREVGILEMEIYIKDNHLFMIVETPLDFEWDSAFARLATLPRQQEWEETVGKYQQCAASATSDQKWQMMRRMFFLYEDKHRSNNESLG